MCTTCGCGHGQVRINGKRSHGHGAPRNGYRLAGQTHGPLDAVHAPDTPIERIVAIERDILSDNDARAARNRSLLAARGIFALNLVSSPGSGKTSLLVDTLRRWADRTPVAVVEGDQQTANDAERIRATGAPAVQINTGKGCHLDARMVAEALDSLEQARAMPDGGLLLIENVGNLVCPAAFDLGEAHKVAILSVTEGEDKPLKYPDMFRAADLLIISKIDLLPHVDFDLAAAIGMARQVRPGLPVIRLSVKSGDGCGEWLDWLAAGCGQGG
ncbi:hydrogenase nickel incorporation protein HypB (plasmid) [Chromobacterium amazonense]|uniref:hydrogenase nickel incorporation protein HypB n=1 Tax=Chromobacterium amazonense TaxID=1382803 RepID=UPI00237E0271|nr:hydrogenase nickel incorporation protein HypB [Chromobacterium amazonense]MDE1711761.1 hydrogenase nickel incorporation protein HypB [Chromobacterium amazonense]